MPLDITLPKGLDKKTLRRVIDDALAEDIGQGDITSMAIIPKDARFTGVMEAREPMAAAGLPIAAEVFRTISPDVSLTPLVADGDRLQAHAPLAEISGPARALLTGERTALNLLQHLSGIATLTRAYVDAVAGSGAVLLDTRKTIPGLRQMAKYATRMGGASNHRMGLSEAILIKDNHIVVAGGVACAIARAHSAGYDKVEVECDALDQVHEALKAGASRILFDNMDIGTLREAVSICAGNVETEASGGVSLETIRAIAETGVAFISVGRLTQSAPAVDIGLDWRTD